MKWNEYKHANEMKKEEKKVVESAENFMELAFKKGRELNKIPNQSP